MIRINLLGHETAKPKRRAIPALSMGGSENAPFILVVVAAVVLVAAAWWWQDRSMRDLRATHQQVTAENEQLAETALRVVELEDRRASVNQRLGIIVDLKKNQSGPVLLLDQISRELSNSVWLTDLTLSAGNVSIIGEGLSELAITDFAQNLRLSPLFADTLLDYTQDTENSVQFQLSTRFVPLSAPPVGEAGGADSGSGR